MANQKYNNLTALMASGGLNWAVDPINAYLLQNAVFNVANTKLSETGGVTVAHVPVQGRQIDATGALLGNPVSFNRITKDQPYQVVIAKETGPSADPLVLTFYDRDEGDDPLILKNNGTLIVRPQLVAAGEPPHLGVWVDT